MIQSLDGSSGQRAPSAELGSGWWRDAMALTEPETRAEDRQYVLRNNKKKLRVLHHKATLTQQCHINLLTQQLDYITLLVQGEKKSYMIFFIDLSHF